MPDTARPSMRQSPHLSRGGWGDRARFAAVLGVWGVVCLGWSLAALLLGLLLPRGRRTAAGQRGIRVGFRFLLWLMQASGLCRFDLSALEGLADDRALVIAANHPSLLDAVLLTAHLPRAVCISKASLWNNPFLGGGVRLAGYLRNDSALALVRTGVAALRAGQHLLVFPEGTRTSPGVAVHGFRGGFAMMAKAAGVPVQTVLIETDNPYLRKGWKLSRMPPLPIVCSVRLGRRFMVEGDVRGFVGGLEQYFRAELLAGAEPPPDHAAERQQTRRVHEPA